MITLVFCQRVAVGLVQDDGCTRFSDPTGPKVGLEEVAIKTLFLNKSLSTHALLKNINRHFCNESHTLGTNLRPSLCAFSKPELAV